MSILIKGMEMPKSCWRCRLCLTIDPDTYLCVPNGIRFDATFEAIDHIVLDCPLIPVPDHGRLIDADAVYKRLQKQAMSVWGDGNPRYQIVLDVMDAIRFAPTIIPADKGGE